MYNIFRILIGVPDYSSSSLFLNEEEAIPPPPTNKILRVYYFFYFFGECCLKKNQNAPRPSEHSPVRGRQNKRLGGTIGYYYDKVGL